MQEREAADECEKQRFIYMDSEIACFNTGLYDKAWQDVYFYCEKNPVKDRQEWKFLSFYNSYTIKYTKLNIEAANALKRANYFDDPKQLIFDVNRSIIPQWNHILYDKENYGRIPESIRVNGESFCQNVIDRAITALRKRVNSNYKTIVPQWYKGRIQLLAPLYLTNNEKPELALVVSPNENDTVYYGHTCLTVEMAYNNARLIARPESYWLQP